MRAVWSGLAGTLAGGTAAATALSWHYSTVLISPRPRFVFCEQVRSVSDGTVVLGRSRATAQPGVWGLRQPAGPEGGPERLSVLGAVLDGGRDYLVRELRAGPQPVAGPAVVDAGPFDPDPSARGLAFTDIDIRTPLGPAPAWEVPSGPGRDAGIGADWVIAVHGRGSSRREALRILPALHRAGMHQLVISYRNDVGAPAAPDGRYHLGDTEWQDLEAAVAYALARGARRVVLLGWSMGAAIGGAFLGRSRLARRVSAVVWDAPLLDWRSTLRLQASNRHLPTPLVGPALALTHLRIGFDADRFDLVRNPPAVRPPTLVVHSDEDTAVPVSDSRALAEAAGRLGWPLRYLEVAGVEHTASWNADPARYERAVTGFLRDVLGR